MHAQVSPERAELLTNAIWQGRGMQIEHGMPAQTLVQGRTLPRSQHVPRRS